ncbi:MAG: CoA transferase, partial [Marinomonas sp.]
QKELDGLINEWTRTIPLTKLEERMNEFGVPCGLIYKAEDMLEDPHFKARQAIVDVEHPDFGPIKMQNVAPRLSDTPGAVRHVGPTLGEDNNYVLGELLNLNDDEQARLKDAGII